MQRADRLPEAHLPHQGSFAGGAWDKAEELRTSRACSQGKHPPLQLRGGEGNSLQDSITNIFLNFLLRCCKGDKFTPK